MSQCRSEGQRHGPSSTVESRSRSYVFLTSSRDFSPAVSAFTDAHPVEREYLEEVFVARGSEHPFLSFGLC